MDIPLARLNAFFSETPAVQLTMPTERSNEDCIGICFNGRFNEFFLRNENSKINDVKSSLPQGILHYFIPNDMGIHSQYP
jgi:hypothetical protein